MKLYLEENDMIKINKKRFLVTLVILLFIGTITMFTTGFVIGHKAAGGVAEHTGERLAEAEARPQ